MRGRELITPSYSITRLILMTLDEVVTYFTWITSIEITNKNAEKLVIAGRNRWKIENQEFNRQKRWQGDIEHACSFHEKAQKNHYLMEQISDFIKQLYEFYFLQKNEIKKAQKNIYKICFWINQAYRMWIIILKICLKEQKCG